MRYFAAVSGATLLGNAKAQFVFKLSSLAFTKSTPPGVDARSIMGVFSLDLSKPREAVIYSEDKEELDRFEEVMKFFL